MNLSLKLQLDKAAHFIHQASLILDQIELDEVNDQNVLKRTRTDLHWANENCTLLGLHQIGQKLEDQP